MSAGWTASSQAIVSLLQQGVSCHQQGRLAEAEAFYRRALALAPTNFDALHLLGVVAHQNGRHADAVELIGKALATNPKEPGAQSNLGLALAALGRLDDALAAFDRALTLQGGNADALLNRGLVLTQLGRHGDALSCYDAVLVLRPGDLRARKGSADAHAALGRYAEALSAYDRVLAAEPNDGEASINRGNVLSALGRHVDALASYDRGAALRPDDPLAHYNRGNVLVALQREIDALAAFDTALALAPDHGLTWINRSNVLLDLARPEAALASADEAVRLLPNDERGHFNRGLALERLDRHADAVVSFGHALALKPDLARALDRRALAYERQRLFQEAVRDTAAALELDADLPYALGNLLNRQLHLGDWTDFERRCGRVVEGVRAGRQVVPPFVLLVLSGSSADQLTAAQTWAAHECPPAATPRWRGERYRHDRIRVGYMSTDFREHPVAYKLVDVIERHEMARFETIAIFIGPDTADAARARMERAFERFVPVRQMRAGEIAQWIRQQEIDILVDLNGYTSNARTQILAERPAPVQVNYLGYPGTMGSPYFDYLLADRFVVPESRRADYSEHIVYLPECFQPNDATIEIPEGTPDRASLGLPDEGFVFCSFNNTVKIVPSQFDRWMRILRRVDGSVLWLLGSNRSVEENLRREAVQRGVAADRLVFAPRIAYRNHLARCRVADLFLDTLPFNAGATASDALWAGLPVLTCAGEAFAARMAGSALTAVGLPELVTARPEDYEELAVTLANEPERLQAIRTRLARNVRSAPLFDTERLCRHLESAYATMWERTQRGEPPVGFSVTPLG